MSANPEPLEPTNTRTRLPYMPGLDGLRALAVMAVFLYHAGFWWAAGGFLGVESFFVVSGYLITALLVGEYQRRGRINLPYFWLRRARRLLPALWLTLFGALLMAWLRAPDAWPRLREDLWGALLYITNWVYVIREIPYFESFGRAPLLLHLWSLAIEEQFYLIWPLLVWGLSALLGVRTGGRGRLLLPILALSAASTILMVGLYNPALDPARIYYGTDTRAAGFLVGAALAVILPPGFKLRHPHNLPWQALPWLALGLLVLSYGRLNEFSDWLYRGGFLITALLTAAVMVSAAQPGTTLSKVLGVAPLRWIGLRSYGIYLWHWPITLVNRHAFECSLDRWGCAAVNLALTLAAAEISYRLVEQPIRRQGFRAWGRAVRRRLPGPVLAAGITAIAGLGVVSVFSLQIRAKLDQPLPEATAIALFATEGLVPQDTPTQQDTPASPPTNPMPTETRILESALQTALAVTGTADGTADGTGTPPDDPPEASPTPVSLSSTAAPSPLLVTLIGDSVMEGTLAYWEGAFEEAGLEPSNFVFDAERKRVIDDLPDLLAALEADDQLAPAVVFHIGTNRPFEPDEFDQLMVLVTEYAIERAVFVNIHRPVPWEASLNRRIAAGVERWPQAELVDWYALSKDNPGYFGEDLTHLTGRGKRAYLAAILDVLALPELASNP